MVRSAIYRIKNAKSGTYLDNSQRNPKVIHGWDSRPDSGNQEWEVRERGDDVYTLKNVASGRWAHVDSGNDGTRLEAEDTEGEASRWEIKDAGDGLHRFKLQGKRGVIDLDMGKDDNGTSISLWGQTDAKWQKWKLERVRDIGGDHEREREPDRGPRPAGPQQPIGQPGGTGGTGGSYRGDIQAGKYFIRNCHTGTALDLSGSDRNDGTAVIGYQVTQGANQQWQLESGVQGYRLRNVATGTYLSVRQGERAEQGKLLTGNNTTNYEWDVRGNQNGYTLTLANSNLLLDLAESNPADGAKICLWPATGNNNQKWNLVQC